MGEWDAHSKTLILIFSLSISLFVGRSKNFISSHHFIQVPAFLEFDPDSLFLSSILPDLQRLDDRKKLELKLDILKLIHTSLYL